MSIQEPFSWRDAALAAVTGAVALLVYWQTLPPSVSGEDSGELITAAYTLGIAHPPGYPLWCLLGKAFTSLPVGTVAWRVNLMSAVLAAITVSVVFLIAFHLTGRRAAAAVAALVFAFSREFWEQSVIAEVYSLNALLVALCVFGLLRWQASRRRGWLVSTAFVFGLALTNHHSTLVILPVLAGFVALVERRVLLSWRLVATTAVAAVAPLALYLYLPIRSAANPPVDWGNPETWSSFLDVVMRKQYSFMFTETPRSPGLFIQQCWTFLTLYVQEFSPWLAWLPVLGAFVLWRRNRPATFLVLGVAAAVLAAVIVVNNFAIEKEAIWVNSVFCIPVYLMAGICASGAVELLMRWSEHGRWRKILAYGGAAVAIASPLLWNYRLNDKSDYLFAQDYAANVFRTMDPNAIYLPSADHATFPCIYLQSVEGMRPDVTIGNKYGYTEPSLYANMDEGQRKRFRKIPTEAEDRFIERWIVEHNPNRPIYFTKKISLEGVPGVRLVSTGLLYRVARQGEQVAPRDYFAEYRWRRPLQEAPENELTAQMIVADVRFAEARAAFERGDAPVALERLAQAMEVCEGDKEAFNNAGSLCAENGQTEKAHDYYSAALRFDPDYGITLRNLGKIYLQAKEYKKALPCFEKLLRKDPLDPEANWLAYECLKGQLRNAEALAQLHRMASFPYEDARVYRELGMHLLNDEQKPRQARQYFAKSLDLAPDQADLSALVMQLDQEGPKGPAGSATGVNPWLSQGAQPYAPRPQVPMPGLGGQGMRAPLSR